MENYYVRKHMSDSSSISITEMSDMLVVGGTEAQRRFCLLGKIVMEEARATTTTCCFTRKCRAPSFSSLPFPPAVRATT
jgi:hypothetical protein